MIPDSERVIQIMREVAAREIMPRFRNLEASDIAEKRNPSDLVTTADLEAERRLSAALTALESNSEVVGEEGAERDPGTLSLLGGEKPVWVIDPVDGTFNYARGRACFAVIVAFCMKGETLAGWILDPASDVVVSAIAGQGASITDERGCRRLRVPNAKGIGDMSGSVGRRLGRLVKARRDSGLSGGPLKTVKYGCTGREYMDLAQGTLDFAQYTRLKPWDHAAGVLIHAEAGGFNRLIESRASYRPQPRVMEETILLAPDEGSWEALHALFDEHRINEHRL
jgi:fructose-1,6-bisphosphatase/inositol monophosphatase family enzyme